MASVAVLEILRSKRIGVTNLTFQGHVTLYLFIYILKCRLCISITVCCWCYNVASVCRRLSVVCNICRPIVVKRCVLPKKLPNKQIGKGLWGTNGHATDDLTWPWKVKVVTSIRVEPNISKTAGDADAI